MSEHMDNLKETLSSLMDSEVDDLELRRVLKAVAEENAASAELMATWHRYHQIRSAVVNKETGATCSNGFLSKVRAGIDQDAVPVRQASVNDRQTGRSRWALAFGQGAIAASVAALVLVASFQALMPGQEQAAELAAEVSEPVGSTFQMAANETLEPTRNFNQVVNLSGELDAQSQDRLRKAVYREFEDPESLQIPVSFQFDEH